MYGQAALDVEVEVNREWGVSNPLDGICNFRSKTREKEVEVCKRCKKQREVMYD